MKIDQTWRNHPFGTGDAGGGRESWLVAAIAARARDQPVGAKHQVSIPIDRSLSEQRRLYQDGCVTRCDLAYSLERGEVGRVRTVDDLDGVCGVLG